MGSYLPSMLACLTCKHVLLLVTGFRPFGLSVDDVLLLICEPIEPFERALPVVLVDLVSAVEELFLRGVDVGIRLLCLVAVGDKDLREEVCLLLRDGEVLPRGVLEAVEDAEGVLLSNGVRLGLTVLLNLEGVWNLEGDTARIGELFLAIFLLIIGVVEENSFGSKSSDISIFQAKRQPWLKLINPAPSSVKIKCLMLSEWPHVL
ncbi:hypothetical protein WICPIJ_006361 [Wickerhamomyces pijperi]|uniref:Uncharacterized protein n=1 Tax=Wickerhamomyces pijperi TaxID=599730 RepID=A0A9P8Q1X9_WICPI|nr:hypothetical protein WICPIJ_006361 [Wickerhamomyces pijperi]